MLSGKSKTIQVEPVELPTTAPEPDEVTVAEADAVEEKVA